MRKIFIAFIVIGAFFLLFKSAVFALEYNRIQNLCRSSHSHIETAHDAIDVMRNYRTSSDWDMVGRILSRARRLDVFQNDGLVFNQTDDGPVKGLKGGGWHVEEWNETFITHGYSVDFNYIDVDKFQPEIEVKCDVVECGAIDISNCLTLGGYYAG